MYGFWKISVVTRAQHGDYFPINPHTVEINSGCDGATLAQVCGLEPAQQCVGINLTAYTFTASFLTAVIICSRERTTGKSPVKLWELSVYEHASKENIPVLLNCEGTLIRTRPTQHHEQWEGIKTECAIQSCITGRNGAKPFLRLNPRTLEVWSWKNKLSNVWTKCKN